MKKSQSHRTDILAQVISRLFDPVWEIPFAIIVTVVFALQEGLRWRFMGLLLFVDALVPMIFFLIMLWHKQIKSWDIQNRAERIPLYLFTTVCHLGGVWMAHELGKTELALTLLTFYAIAMVFLAITFFWKISLHTGVNAVLMVAINVFTNGKYWYLFVFLPIVAWARVYQKHHTWGQLVAGAVIGGVMCYLGLKWVGF